MDPEDLRASFLNVPSIYRLEIQSSWKSRSSYHKGLLIRPSPWQSKTFETSS